MSSIPLQYSNDSVTVCTRAFTINDTSDGLDTLRSGHLVHLPDDALGLSAGYYQAGYYQGRPEQGQRTLVPLSDAEAASTREKGATVSQATPAPNWAHPFAIAVEGMRIRELRAFLTENPELPDDALVVIGPADHHLDSEDSPASTGLALGAYVPAMSGRGNYGDFWDPECSEDPRPERSIPAVRLWPSA